MLDYINVKGAKEHNLKDVSINIPKNKLVIFTGVSGSGKSSLAMDTIYAEGQRRYVESLSSYARQFLGVMKKPEVESIDGLSPAIAIDQKTVSHNPRSTVGTVTEIYDYLRLLFARIGHPHCHNCGREIEHLSVDQIVNSIINTPRTQNQTRILLLAPIVKDRKGEYSNLLDNLKKQGYARVRIDGKIYLLEEEISLIKTNKHTIEAVIDRLTLPSVNKIDKDLITRLTQSVETSLNLGNGYIIMSEVSDKSFDFPESPQDMKDTLYSEKFACPSCNISFPEIEPRTFSFNSPHGACEECTGLGTLLIIDEKSLLAPELTILEGGLLPWASQMENNSWNRTLVEAVSRKFNINLNLPVKDLPSEHLNILLYGTNGDTRSPANITSGHKESYTIKYKGREFDTKFEGLVPNLERRYQETDSDYIRSEIEKFMIKEPCPKCNGARLKKEALSITIKEKNIAEVSELSIMENLEWVKSIEKTIVSSREIEISRPIMFEIVSRLTFLVDVGLTYLTVNRGTSTLAGGEAQRIRLASQIGSKLSGVLYVLDEPSIGLHPRDHSRLIKTLKNLRDLGNTVIVVEHDEQTMLESDYIFDFGPGAGHKGGTLTAEGTPEQLMKNPNSLTGSYLSGKKKVDFTEYLLPEEISKVNELSSIEAKDKIVLTGCTGHNLKKINVNIPLRKLVCVTGVSGSGKSTLVNETLLKMLKEEKGLKNDEKPAPNTGISGGDKIDKVINIDQSPIGRTPRSNPATYTKVFDLIRDLFTQTQAAKMRGYKQGRFSFNVKGGRCEACQGDGQIKIEMQFMPDVYIDCEVCGGKRYNRETLEIEYKDKNIADVLELTVDDAMEFFVNHPLIHHKLSTLSDVGLGYIKLGQPAPTLSGGEAQRVKLSAELAKKATGNTLYILDEPTTGLHFADLERLIAIIKRLVLKGNSVVVIEHNLDVIRNADWVIDLGPEGGKYGGEILFEGTVNNLLKDKDSHTAEALRRMVKS
jgi:excinuclease ABC subunit A